MRAVMASGGAANTGAGGFVQERMTRKEAAEYLRLSARTLAQWVTNGKQELPYYKVSNRVIYLRSDLDAFLESTKMLHSGKKAN